jgi:hydrogenase maturation protein HypF
MSVTLMFRAQEWQERAAEEELYSLNNTIVDIRDTELILPEQNEKGEIILPTEILFQRVVEMILRNEDSGKTAFFFHAVLAEQIVSAVRKAGEQTGIDTAALSGGVFQNLLLLEMTDQRLEEEGMRVIRHSMVPPNDGGIALGQAVAAMEYLQR